jgi:hypothetical protein
MHTHTAEPLVPGPSHLEFRIVISKLKEYKCPGSDPAELIQARGETLVSVIHTLENIQDYNFACGSIWV